MYTVVGAVCCDWVYHSRKFHCRWQPFRLPRRCARVRVRVLLLCDLCRTKHSTQHNTCIKIQRELARTSQYDTQYNTTQHTLTASPAHPHTTAYTHVLHMHDTHTTVQKTYKFTVSGATTILKSVPWHAVGVYVRVCECVLCAVVLCS